MNREMKRGRDLLKDVAADLIGYWLAQGPAVKWTAFCCLGGLP